MKVIYEFSDEDNEYKRKIFEMSSSMYNSLAEIDEYIRMCRKGRNDDDIEKVIDTIGEFIYNSRIDELE